jgi:flagellar protein FliO/FliZ
MSSGIAPLLWFAGIVGLIPLALWLLKRTPMGGAGANGVLRSVAVLPMSPSQRIVTVEVGCGEQRKWLVLGVTAQTISTLHCMEPLDHGPDAPQTPASPFSQLLGRLPRKETSA